MYFLFAILFILDPPHFVLLLFILLYSSLCKLLLTLFIAYIRFKFTNLTFKLYFNYLIQ